MWYLRTFGGLSLETDGRTAPSATRRRPLALLALLALAGERGSSREKVVALLWPESDEEHGRNSLSQALASLRRDMAAKEPVVGSSDIRLDPSVITSDVAEFERFIASGELDRAAQLYQGPFLDGFYVREAAEFERWTDEQRRRLHEGYAAILSRLARAADERLDHEAAIGWWKRFAALEPTNAQAVSGLMRSLAGVGDRAGAQRQYRIYEELMRHEFGVGPEPAISSLATSLLAGAQMPTMSHNGQLARHSPQNGVTQYGVAVVTRDNGFVNTRWNPARRIAIAGVLIAVAALACVVAISARRNGTPASSAERRVVVRTFRNTTGDANLDPIGVMAADWIARRLAETPSIDVAGTDSDITARDPVRSQTPALAATALGQLMHARYVISGSYTTQGDSLFAQAEVWDAQAGRLVKSIPAVGAPAQTRLAVLERLRERVADALVPFFDSSVVTASRVPPKYEAYEEFLAGDALYESDHTASIRHLRTAVRLDSSFIFARLRLISAFEIGVAFAQRDSAISDAAAKRGLMSPYEAAAFDLRVAIARRDYHAAYLSSVAAHRLAPSSSWAGFEAGEVALIDGRPREAVRLLEALDPESGALRSTHAYYSELCRAYHDLDRTRDLRGCYNRSRKQYPRIVMPWVMAVLGDSKRFEQVLDSLLSLGGTKLDSVGAIGGLYEMDAHGHSNEARAIGQRLLAHARRRLDDSLASRALVNTRVGLLGYLEEWRELARLVDSTPAQYRSHYALSLRWMASAMLGDTIEARRHAEARAPEDSLLNLRDRARIFAALGDRQRAFAILRTFAHPAFWWQYHEDVFFRLMRGYEPFEQLLKPRD